MDAMPTVRRVIAANDMRLIGIVASAQQRRGVSTMAVPAVVRVVPPMRAVAAVGVAVMMAIGTACGAIMACVPACVRTRGRDGKSADQREHNESKHHGPLSKPPSSGE